MIGFLEYAGSFILVLGPLVFVHELGHFLVAKWLGVRVKVFSIGFGPRLLGFRRGDTDYRVAAVPLGGYVRMAGDESDEERTGAADEFLSRPRFQRFLVYVAGAAFNVALALLLTWVALVTWGQTVVDAYPVVRLVEPGSLAAQAGFRQGDRILEIAGRDARNVDVEIEEIVMSPETAKSVVFERDGRRLETTVETGSEPRHHMGDPGWYLLRSEESPMVGDVLPGEPAARAGLRAGDRIVGAEGQEPIGEVRLRGLLKASPGVDLTLVVERDGVRVKVPIRPDDKEGEGRIGAVFYTPLPRRSIGAIDAIAESVRTNVEQSAMLFVVLEKLFRTEISLRAFSGPLEIAQFSRAAVGSLERFLTFLALLSLQLGILNLLPIPVLDGGHIVILTVEGVMRRELSDRVKERVMLAGLLFLLAFFGVILTFDVLKLGS